MGLPLEAVKDKSQDSSTGGWGGGGETLGNATQAVELDRGF